MILKIYLFMLSFLFIVASRADMHPMIIGGVEVAPNDPIAKSTVFIEGQLIRSSFYCTGSIIAPDLILTAGHCLGGAGNARLTVYFRTRVDGPGEKIAVVDQIRKIDIIPQDVSSWEDIAILRLATVIPPGYQVAHLLDDSSLLQIGQTVVLAGYGRTAPEPSSSGEQQGLGVLRTVEQNIMQSQYNANEFLVDLTGKIRHSF